MMNEARLEAFGDAVLAIVITIMVLELHAPEAASLEALMALAPRFLSYLLSFIFLAFYVAVAAIWLVPDRRFEPAP